MILKKLLDGIDYELIKGNIDEEIIDISYDSRNIKKGYAFVCLIGIDTDGHNYISNAIEKGANVIFVCKDVNIDEDVTIIKLDNTRTKLSYLSANLFKHPADKLIKIAITGTKGKTSTSLMIKNILEQSNEKVGVIGTIGMYYNQKWYEHKNTTPESYYVQKFMRQMVDAGIKYLVMETSSLALKVGRINNILFDYGIFTNLSMDHVGPREHPTYEDYVQSKMLLFKQSKIGIACKDDKEFDRIIKNSNCKIISFGQNKESDYVINNINYIKENSFLGTKFKLNSETYKISAPGEFSAYNAACAIILCKKLNIEDNMIKKGLETFYAQGRCEIININNKFNVVIDYAHNKISMESIIKTMKNYSHNRIISIYGCGGGRSCHRRYDLGVVGAKLSDLNIITTDNPRNDDVDDIISTIVTALQENNGNYKIIKDRKEAIEYAMSIAKENDIILILGKGHEKYQEIKGVIYPFDERKIVTEYTKKIS